MRAILDAVEAIAKAGGTSLGNLTRAHHFVQDLNVVLPALKIWQERMPNTPLPFGAVRTPKLPIPGCEAVVDTWFYRP